MRDSVAANHAFVRKEIPFDDGRAVVEGQGQGYKVEILDDLAAKAKAAGEGSPSISFYEHGPFSDLCRGPHVASTGKIGPFKLLSVAGAYWRGDEKRPMLQRIYGTVWADQAALDAYLWRRAEAKKRDHRKLGVQLDLFSFHDVSPGAAFWHPEGPDALAHCSRAPCASCRTGAATWRWRRRSSSASGSGASPGTGTSTGTTCSSIESENQTFSLKPMNCPEIDVHLPLAAALVPRPAAALQRVRPAAPQRALGHADRAHARAPVRPGRRAHLRPAGPAHGRDHRRSSARSARRTGWFGLTPRFSFATKPDKAIGDPALWERAERLTIGGVRRRGHQLRAEAQGRHVLRAEDRHLHRRRPRPRVADGDDPDRPDDAARAIRPDLRRRRRASAQRPMAIHRAIYGIARAVHRHPDRALRRRVPALDRARAGRRSSRSRIGTSRPPRSSPPCSASRGLRVEVDGSDSRMQNKIRLAQEQKVPYMLVLGDREVEA